MKKRVNGFEKIWKEIKRKNIDEWEPSETDIAWLQGTIKNMRVGGVWYLPAAGATFRKIGSNHIKLESIVTEKPLDAMIIIGKTKERVRERMSITPSKNIKKGVKAICLREKSKPNYLPMIPKLN
jgi:hypothetical protein